MYKVQFNNFRCFGKTPSVEIRPLTFLVGENSAGKTTFLAGLRFLLESLSRRTVSPFNREPFFLGGFEQIAHFRGGRGGRAKKFNLSIALPLSLDEQSVLPDDTARQAQEITHSFEFVEGPTPQPHLESYRFEVGQGRAAFSFTSDVPKISIGYSGESWGVSNLRGPSSSIIQDSTYFLTYLFDELLIGPRARRNSQELQLELESSPDRVMVIEELQKHFRATRNKLGREVFASAPVRSQPLRTYTPSDILASSEGAHVPLELARAKIQSPERWKRVKASLLTFGKSSGLFSDIDIRKLGRSDIDPFQLLVKIGGPAMNILDVGYGVSQVLPIVYQIQNRSRFDTFLFQQPEVHIHPKAQAELGSLMVHTSNVKSPPYYIVETHSDYLIDRVRMEISEGTIPNSHVTILFFERRKNGSTVTNIFMNDKGEITNPPRRFRSFFIEEHARMLGIE